MKVFWVFELSSLVKVGRKFGDAVQYSGAALHRSTFIQLAMAE